SGRFFAPSEPGSGHGDFRAHVAEEIPLAEVDAVVAQDVVGGGEVEIEIGQHKILQVDLPGGERHAVGTDGEADGPRLTALHLGGAELVQVGGNLGDPGNPFIEAGF